MHRSARAFRRSIVPGIVAGVFALGAASAQTGSVLSFQKISTTQGNFTGAVDSFDEFGGVAVGLGDLDGAGPSAFAMAVGAALDDDGGGSRGAVYILFMNSAGSVMSSQKISNLSGGFTGLLDNFDEFGTSVAFLGDLDGPGPSVAAIAVGAPGDDDGGLDRGAVYILFLSSTGTVLSNQKISSTSGGVTPTLHDFDEFGGATARFGILNGTSKTVGALVVGAVGDDDGGADRGAVYELFLDKTGSVLSFQKISNTQGGFAGVLDNGDNFGSAMVDLGDLDGAGPSASALAVGAVFDDDGGADRGAVYVLFLSRTGLVLSFQKIGSLTGNFAGPLDNLDEFGGSLENLGDMDGAGAGVTTLAVGATGDDDGGGDRGAVYLLNLSATGTVTSSSKLSSTAGNFAGPLDNVDGFGSATAYLGDLDGAGPSGVALAVGATGDDDGGTDRGAMYVLFLAGTPTTDVPVVPQNASAGLLGRAKPNPFHLRTTLSFRLNEAAEVQIEIQDVSGRVVRRFARVQRGPGQHGIEWDGLDDSGRALAAGTYFYRMSVNGRAVPTSERAVLLR
jgi:flagellar hook capping protein FlgD